MSNGENFLVLNNLQCFAKRTPKHRLAESTTVCTLTACMPVELVVRYFLTVQRSLMHIVAGRASTMQSRAQWSFILMTRLECHALKLPVVIVAAILAICS